MRCESFRKKLEFKYKGYGQRMNGNGEHYQMFISARDY